MMKFRAFTIVMIMSLMFGSMALVSKSQDTLNQKKTGTTIRVLNRDLQDTMAARSDAFEKTLSKFDSVVLGEGEKTNRSLRADIADKDQTIRRLNKIIALIPEKTLRDYKLRVAEPMEVVADSSNKLDLPVVEHKPVQKKTFMQKLFKHKPK